MRKATGWLDDHGFSRKSKKLTDDAWFYEGRGGLTVAVTMHGTSQSIVGTVEIPWHKLKGPLRRYATYKRRSKAA